MRHEQNKNQSFDLFLNFYNIQLFVRVFKMNALSTE